MNFRLKPFSGTPPISIEQTIPKCSAQVTVWYGTNQLLADVRYSQTMNYILISCGMLLSMVAAYLFSKQRQEHLRRLEEVIESPQIEDKDAGLGEFEYLRQLIARSAKDNTAELKKYNELLKQQTAAMIFNGVLHDRDEIDQALSRCGIILNEEYYFVGGILSDDLPEARQRLKNMLSGDLFCEAEVKGVSAIVFLAELPNNDRSRNMRMKLTEKLMQILSLNGSSNIRICVSQVYRYLPLANLAYMEAMSAMESLQNYNHAGIHVLFWENMIRDNDAPVQFSPDELTELSEQVEQRSDKLLQACLHRLCQYIDTSNGIAENKRYLRYCILQSVVTSMKAVATGSDQALLTEMIRVNPSEEDTFEKKVYGILHRFCNEQTPNGDFQKILAYIDAHYTDNDLTAEQVAQQIGYTKYYLAKLFKSRVGCSYIDYLTKLRMYRACQLLKETELSVSEIVGQVGYVDDSSFRRKFKQIYGMSMSEYRIAKPPEPEK